MKIEVRCPECSQPYRVPASVAGKRIACKKCSAAIPVPAAGAEEPAAAQKPKQAKPRPAARSTSSEPARGSGSKRSSRGQSNRPAAKNRGEARRDGSRRQRKRRDEDVVEDFEEITDYEDDLFGDDGFDDLPAYGGSSRGRRKSKRDSSARWVRIGLIIFAIALCIRTVGFGSNVIAQLVAQSSAARDNGETILTLLKTDVWLRMVALAAMVIAYGFLVAGRDREGSQGWAIASVVLGAIAAAAFCIMHVMPLFDEERESAMSLVEFAFQEVGYGGITRTLWESVFRNWILTALYLSPLFTALLFLRAFFHSDKVIPGRSAMTMLSLGGHAGVIVLKGLLLIFVIKVILPSAMENREPPSEMWRYMQQGMHWIGLVAFLVFLILALRVFFGAIPEAK